MARIETAFDLAPIEAQSPSLQYGEAQSCQASDDSDTSRRTCLTTGDIAEAVLEHAIKVQGLEVELHIRLRDDAQRRYAVSSCLLDHADADRHLLQARQAAELMRALQATKGKA